MAAMFGGIVGQEIVKACSGKFHPLFQVLFLSPLPFLCSFSFILNEIVHSLFSFFIGEAAEHSITVDRYLCLITIPILFLCSSSISIHWNLFL
jgi:hypothetical protein